MPLTLKNTILTKETDFELIRSIAKKMQDPLFVKRVITDPLHQNPDPIFKYDRWSDLSMGAGYPGILPLFTELETLFPEDGWERALHQYVVQMVQSIESTPLTHLSMFGGLTGVCFSLRLASQNEHRYKKILDKLDHFLIEQLSITYLLPLEEQLKKAIPKEPILYETIQGLSGMGIYCLMNVKKPLFQKLTKDIIQKLILLTHPIKIQNKIVPGWYVSPSFFFQEADKKTYPNGNFNLGLSHGITGVLAFLSIAFIYGMELEGHKEAIRKIADWLQKKRKILGDRFFWDTAISFEEEILCQSTAHAKSRDAWCYGTPGVARSLYLAGKALQDKNMENFAIEAFISIFKSSREEWDLPGPTICHGLAGLLMITQLMARDTNHPCLLLEAQNLRKMILSYYDPTSHFGFKNPVPLKNKKGQYAWLETADLLEGTTGVLLTLCSSHSTSYQWQLPFLVDTL